MTSKLRYRVRGVNKACAYGCGCVGVGVCVCVCVGVKGVYPTKSWMEGYKICKMLNQRELIEENISRGVGRLHRLSQ